MRDKRKALVVTTSSDATFLRANLLLCVSSLLSAILHGMC